MEESDEFQILEEDIDKIADATYDHFYNLISDDYDLETPNEDDIIWRYIDFTQYMSLLETESLFFPRPKTFNDPFEGSLPKKNVERRNQEYRQAIDSLDLNFDLDSLEEAVDMDFLDIASNTQEDILDEFGVSCWHKKDHESAAMWNTYSKDGSGIALQSTAGDLLEALPTDEMTIALGDVQYVDYDTDMIGNPMMEPMFTKRKEFSHESEVRAIVHISDIENDAITKEIEKGVYINVDIEQITQNIVLSPSSEDWFQELVRSVSDSYDLESTVRVSDLDDDPMF